MADQRCANAYDGPCDACGGEMLRLDEAAIRQIVEVQEVRFNELLQNIERELNPSSRDRFCVVM